MVSTFSGNGTQSSVNGSIEIATFNNPKPITYDPFTSTIFLIDFSNKIRKITSGSCSYSFFNFNF